MSDAGRCALVIIYGVFVLIYIVKWILHNDDDEVGCGY